MYCHMFTYVGDPRSNANISIVLIELETALKFDQLKINMYVCTIHVPYPGVPMMD